MKKINIAVFLVSISVYGHAQNRTLNNNSLTLNSIAKNERTQTANPLPGGVTNIKEVINRTSYTVKVNKWDTPAGAAAEHYETTGVIPPHGVYSGDIWIPWANNEYEFLEHKMEIRVNGNIIAHIWQSGEYIRFKTNIERFAVNAPIAPGFSRSGGDRKLVITARSNQILFTFERY